VCADPLRRLGENTCGHVHAYTQIHNTSIKILESKILRRYFRKWAKQAAIIGRAYLKSTLTPAKTKQTLPNC
jgi:hypothetical protein